MVDHRRAEHAPGSCYHLEQLGWEPRLAQELHRDESGEGCLGVWLEDDAVAGEQRGDGVGDGEGQRIVPGADDPHDTLGVVVLGRAGQDRERALATDRPQVLRRAVGVIASRHRDVRHLFEGADPGLAGLGLGDVEELLLAVEHEVVVGEHDVAALDQRATGPRSLGDASSVHGLDDVVGGAGRHLSDQGPVERRERSLC